MCLIIRMNKNIIKTIYTKVEYLHKDEVENIFKSNILKSIIDFDIPVETLICFCDCTLDDIIYSLSYSNLWYIDKSKLPTSVHTILEKLHNYLDHIEGTFGEEYYIWCMNEFVINAHYLVQNMSMNPKKYGLSYDITPYLPFNYNICLSYKVVLKHSSIYPKTFY
jgi:hypothetical protein